MNSAQDVLTLAESLDVRVWRTGDALEFDGPTTPELLQGLQEYKGPILAILDKNGTEPPPAPPDDDQPDFPITDAGNAEMFAHLHGDKVRYDHRRKRWLMWNGSWWSDDADGEVIRMAKETARKRFVMSWDIEDEMARRAAAKWAFQSESRGRMDGALALAQSEHPIADAGDKWDLDPWLLGVPNGVVQLSEGKLRKGKQLDRITMHTSVPFDPIKTPRWNAFLKEVFVDDELIDWIWRALGYSITGITNEQVVFICHGNGANGKSKFLGTIRNILGAYAHNTPFTTLEANKNRSTITNDVAALVGRRFVTASETSESTRFNEARVKSLSGGDRQTARFLYGENFEFEPVCKLWLAVNHRPKVYDESYAFWRRVRLIPFEVTFEKDTEDKDLDLKLQPEYPGIMAWLVQGCLEWQQRGLDPPDCVLAATQEYRQEANPLGEFMQTCLVSTQPGMFTSSKELFEAYNAWAEEESLTQRERLTRNKFGRIMGQTFGKPVQATSGPHKNRMVFRQVAIRGVEELGESRGLQIQPPLNAYKVPLEKPHVEDLYEKPLSSSTPLLPEKDETRDPWD